MKFKQFEIIDGVDCLKPGDFIKYGFMNGIFIILRIIERDAIGIMFESFDILDKKNVQNGIFTYILKETYYFSFKQSK